MMTGRSGTSALDAGQEIDAAFAGQREVEEQEVVGVAGEEIETGVAVGGEIDAEALEHEEGFEGLADTGFVVDYEDFLAHGIRRDGGCVDPVDDCVRHVLPFLASCV